MLVLSRRVGEEIVIDGAIRVKVVAMDNRRVRLGVVAPEKITVDREEIHERKKAFFEEETSERSLQDIGELR